jgi:hypothetical protein
MSLAGCEGLAGAGGWSDILGWPWAGGEQERRWRLVGDVMVIAQWRFLDLKYVALSSVNKIEETENSTVGERGMEENELNNTCILCPGILSLTHSHYATAQSPSSYLFPHLLVSPPPTLPFHWPPTMYCSPSSSPFPQRRQAKPDLQNQVSSTYAQTIYEQAQSQQHKNYKQHTPPSGLQQERELLFREIEKG